MQLQLQVLSAVLSAASAMAVGRCSVRRWVTHHSDPISAPDLFHNRLHEHQQQAMAEVIIVAAALVAAFGCVGAGFYGVANTVNSTKKHLRTRKVLHTGIRYKQPATASAGDRSRACSCEEVVSLKKRCKRKLKKSSVKKDVRVFSDGHVEAHGLISYPTTECSICLDECKEGDRMVLLLCRHTLHVKCVSKWLKQHTTCPLCKADLLELAAQHNYKHHKLVHGEEHELELHDQQQQLQLQQQREQQQAVACLQLARNGSDHTNITDCNDDDNDDDVNDDADVEYDSSDERVGDVPHCETAENVTSEDVTVAPFATVARSSSSDSAASVSTVGFSPSSAEQSRSQRVSSSSSSGSSLKQRLQSARGKHRVAPTSFGATLDDDDDGTVNDTATPTTNSCNTSDETATVVL